MPLVVILTRLSKKKFFSLKQTLATGTFSLSRITTFRNSPIPKQWQPELVASSPRKIGSDTSPCGVTSWIRNWLGEEEQASKQAAISTNKKYGSRKILKYQYFRNSTKRRTTLQIQKQLFRSSKFR